MAFQTILAHFHQYKTDETLNKTMVSEMQRCCNYACSVYVNAMHVGTQVCKRKQWAAAHLSLVSVYKYITGNSLIITLPLAISRRLRNQRKWFTMNKRRWPQHYDDCIDSRLLMAASLSPWFASSTDLITSTSTSGNMSLTTATSSSVTGLAAAGCCCGIAALAGTAAQFTQAVIKDQLNIHVERQNDKTSWETSLQSKWTNKEWQQR